MMMWNGACIVHDEFKGLELDLLKAQHPGAKVLVHPESPKSVVEQADVVGSTTQILNAVLKSDAPDLHRGHRQRHPARMPAARAGQDADRGAHGRQQRHVQELRALPVDGDERAAGRSSAACENGTGEIRVDEAGAPPGACGCIERHARTSVAHHPGATQTPGLVRQHRRRVMFADANESVDEARARNIRDALAEDIGKRRLDGRSSCPRPSGSTATCVVREDAGAVRTRLVRRLCLHALDASAAIDWHFDEGAAMHASETVLHHRRGGPRPADRPSGRRSTSCSCCRPPRRSRASTSTPFAARRRTRVAARSWTRARRCRACARRRSTRCAWAAGRTSASRSGTAS
jgi:hypothetical protein